MLRKLPAYRVYLLVQGVFALAFTTFATLSALYRIRDVGLNPFELVLVGTVLEVAAFSGEVPTGVVADVYSRRLSIIIGMFLFGLGFMFEGLFPFLVTVLIAQVIWGIGSTFISGALEAWIADELGEEGIGRVYLRGSQIGQIGGVLGIGVAVALGSVTLGLPLVAGGAILVGLGVFLIFVMPEDNFHRTPRGERSNWSSMAETFTLGVQTIRGRPVLVTIILIAVLFGAASEGYDRLADKHLVDNFVFPSLPAGPLDDVAVWFGLLSVAAMLINIGVNEVARRRLDTDSHESMARTLLGSNVLIIAFIIGFALAGQFALAVTFMLLVRVSRSIGDPLTLAWLNQSLSSRVRATVMSMRGQADALGQIAGGPILGLIATAISLRFSFLVVAAILTPTLYLYVRTIRHGRLAAAPSSGGGE